MKDFNCQYCKKALNLGEIVVSNDEGELFCMTERSPLEPDSCALKYLTENPEKSGKIYFFIKLGGDK
jgi:hypothetical protein